MQFPESILSQQALAKTDKCSKLQRTTGAPQHLFGLCLELRESQRRQPRSAARRPAEMPVNDVETKVKRLWERSAFLSQRNIDVPKHELMLEGLQPILEHWVAELSQIAAHAETLTSMLKRRVGGFQEL